jgi:5-methylcytosine-specific restriction protein A
MKKTIEQILQEYVDKRKNEDFTQNPMHQLVKNTLKQKIIETAHIDPKHYAVKCSVGQGVWARVPWACVFDKDVTSTAQKGFYIVYLFAEDMSGLYLSLNQGWTFYQTTYPGNSMAQIKRIASYLRGKLRSDHSNFPETFIDLRATNQLGRGYEAGNIIAKYYPRDDIPSDAALANDLRQLMGIFLEMKDFIPRYEEDLGAWVDKCNITIDTGIEEDDEQFQATIQDKTPKPFEDKPAPPPTQNPGSSRKSYKRDPQRAKNALDHAGYRCEIDPTHETFVGKASGKPYVEVHHLIPMSQQDNYPVSLDVEANIVALCPTCHRKIHLGTTEEVDEMRNMLLGKRRDRLEKAGLL